MKKVLKEQPKNKVADARFYDSLILEKESEGCDLLFSDLDLTLQFLEQIKEIFKDKEVLEIGCGVGHLASVLKKKFKIKNIIATDISAECIKRAKKLYPNIDFEVMKGEDLRFEKKSFGLVISIETLEHIANYRRHLKEVKRVLKPGGYYIVETPNKPFNLLWETLRGNRGKVKFWHPSLFTPKSLTKEMNKLNFVVKFYKQRNFTPKSEKKLKKVFGPFGSLIAKLFPFRFLPIGFSPTLFLKAEKSE